MTERWYVLPPAQAAALGPVVGAACADHPHRLLTAAGPAPVQQALAQAERRGALPLAICLIGPAAALPHAAYDDPTGRDPVVLTDNDYGATAPIEGADRFGPAALPQVSVCRVPTLDPALVGRLLRVRDALPLGWTDGLGLTCARWATVSSAALAAMGGAGAPLHVSPPLRAATLGAALPPRPRRVYANLHGSDQAGAWYGEGDGKMPEALLPAHLAQPAPNALLLSEACYGARHEPDEDTVARSFLAGGGAAMVGSTVVAWGPITPPIGLADVIIVETLRAIDAGATLPDALHAARRALLADRSHLDPQEANTLASFVALGGPLARAPVRTASSPAAPLGILDRVRAARDARAGDGPLGAARARLREAERRGQWRAPARLHLSAPQLRARFASADAIQARLREALGGEPDGLDLIEYEAAAGPKRQLLAAAGGRCVALVLGAGGDVERTYFTRAASSPP